MTLWLRKSLFGSFCIRWKGVKWVNEFNIHHINRSTKKYFQKVASDLVKFLMVSDKKIKILLHGFSIGGYVWGECLVLMEKNREKYQSLINRIVGQIWDSAADIVDITNGAPKAIFPNSPKLEETMRKYMHYHFSTFHDFATQHYLRASQAIYNSFVQAPALIFVSKNDLIGDEPSNWRIIQHWRSRGFHVTWKCFDDSPHVGHFYKHRQEYLKYLNDYLKLIGLFRDSESLRSKLWVETDWWRWVHFELCKVLILAIFLIKNIKLDTQKMFQLYNDCVRFLFLIMKSQFQIIQLCLYYNKVFKYLLSHYSFKPLSIKVY